MNDACMFWDSKGNKTLSYNPESRNWKAISTDEEFAYTEEEPGETEAYSEDYYDQESYDESYDEGMIPEATNDGTME